MLRGNAFGKGFLDLEVNFGIGTSQLADDIGIGCQFTESVKVGRGVIEQVRGKSKVLDQLAYFN